MESNPWHHLFMLDPPVLVAKSPLEWAGPLFWVWVTTSYALVFAPWDGRGGWSPSMRAVATGKNGSAIRLRARKHARTIRIELKDNGPDIPADLRKKIFEPFFTTSENEIGSRLGLAISAKLVADFGGWLSHEPIATGGARFMIELPEGSVVGNGRPRD